MLKSLSAELDEVLGEIKTLILEKNRRYGNSVLSPLRVFSQADSLEQINVRIDDKLSRIKNLQGDDAEDQIMDLIGYLVLRKIHERNSK